MELTHIAVFTAAAVPYGFLLPARWRRWVLMVASVVAIYWLQPALIVRYLDFALPSAMILLSVAVWWISREPGAVPNPMKEDRKAFVVIVALIVGMSFMRYIDEEVRITASRPPDPLSVTLAVGGSCSRSWAYLANERTCAETNRVVLILVIIGLFAVLKAGRSLLR
jgi:hypothetical protein